MIVNLSLVDFFHVSSQIRKFSKVSAAKFALIGDWLKGRILLQSLWEVEDHVTSQIVLVLETFTAD